MVIIVEAYTNIFSMTEIVASEVRSSALTIEGSNEFESTFAAIRVLE
ncbi:hypothetical protein AALP_AA8G148000 [Arabis alpina]|uniref:Uncharacterized protein n=1 Tax=Arabis alpina TaxID=50452 RepID=A0A087G751_ARAAL|nr:hypothetical protein AALP_AA8G148000 [Arabis alpina]